MNKNITTQNTNNNLPGIFIVFEGIDGSGKSTLAEELYCELNERGIPVILTSEPYKSGFGADVRNLFKKHDGVLSVNTELFLFEAARVEHVNNVIIPALEEGKIVICDRFADSTYSYQGIDKNASETILELNKIATGGLLPNITFLIDTDVDLAMSRSKKSDSKDFLCKSEYQRIRNAYLDLASKNPERYCVISGDETIPKLMDIILSEIEKEKYWRKEA